jgi:hypothetical protein
MLTSINMKAIDMYWYVLISLGISTENIVVYKQEDNEKYNHK